MYNINNSRYTGVKIIFPFPKFGLLCKEIITLRLLPHVIKGHTFSYRPSSHLERFDSADTKTHYYLRLRDGLSSGLAQLAQVTNLFCEFD